MFGQKTMASSYYLEAIHTFCTSVSSQPTISWRQFQKRFCIAHEGKLSELCIASLASKGWEREKRPGSCVLEIDVSFLGYIEGKYCKETKEKINYSFIISNKKNHLLKSFLRYGHPAVWSLLEELGWSSVLLEEKRNKKPSTSSIELYMWVPLTETVIAEGENINHKAQKC